MTRTLFFIFCCVSCVTILLSSRAWALTDEEHYLFLKSSPAYADADRRLGDVWRQLRSRLPKGEFSRLLAEQRLWLHSERDMEASSLKRNMSDADAYATTTMARIDALVKRYNLPQTASSSDDIARREADAERRRQAEALSAQQEVQRQQAELQAQQENLRQQAEVLSAQREALRKQAEELSAQQENQRQQIELQAQQEIQRKQAEALSAQQEAQRRQAERQTQQEAQSPQAAKSLIESESPKHASRPTGLAGVTVPPVVDDLIALFSGNKPESIWLYLGLATALAVFGLYQSQRGNAVVFANYTDVACTILTLVLSIVVLFILSDSNMPRAAKIITSLIPTLAVAKATFSYNQSIFSFLLSLFTKFYLVIVYLLALVFIIAMVFGGERKKYERKSGLSARQAGKAAAGVAGATGVFAWLVKLGLHSPGFVPLPSYFSGSFAAK